MNRKMQDLIETFLYCDFTVEEMNRLAQESMPGEYVISECDRGLRVQFKSAYHKTVWEIQNSDMGLAHGEQ